MDAGNHPLVEHYTVVVTPKVEKKEFEGEAEIHLKLVSNLACLTINSADFLNLDDAGLGNGLEGVSLKRDGSAVIDQTVKLKNGIPKIVKFTHQDDETVDSQGLFDHAFWFLGGNEDLSKNKNATIVTITAYYNN